MYSEKRQFGNKGEDIACLFLTKHGFTILERNYLKKWGEIDIVAQKEGRLRFIEVKSAKESFDAVPHVTSTYRPEDNVHPGKLRRLFRTIESYLMDKGVDCDWQIDIMTVKIDEAAGKAKVEIIENIAG